MEEKVSQIISRLERVYPEAECALDYGGEPYKLLIMARLSAQCTDARVNTVCAELFAKYPDLQAFADADISQLERDVYPCGLFRVKARDIKSMCASILRDFGGQVPDTMEALLTLSGVGRKIANLILGDVYGKPAIVADTHCIRVSNRLGLAGSKDPLKVENALKAVIPPELGNAFCHRLVLFGRHTCKAKIPVCMSCVLSDLCRYNK